MLSISIRCKRSEAGSDASPGRSPSSSVDWMVDTGALSSSQICVCREYTSGGLSKDRILEMSFHFQLFSHDFF